MTNPHRTAESATVFRVAVLDLDLVKRNVSRAGQAIRLHTCEFLLLEVLMRAEG